MLGSGGVAAIALAVGLLVTGCQQEQTQPEVSPSLRPTESESQEGGGTGLSLNGLEATMSVDDAQAALDLLAEATRVVVRPYDRDDYGERWEDVDGNGCNQRDDVLLRDAVPGSVTLALQGDCDHDVLAGAWDDPYTGARLEFDDLKASDQAQAIPIDHLVALSEAHQSGADRWDAQQRAEFANDRGNLLAVDGPSNNDKGDSDPAEWMPSYEPSHCAYAVLWVEVKDAWDLAVDDQERAAVGGILAEC